MVEWLNVGDVDDEKITGFGAFDIKRASEVVDFGEINIANIVCTVVVSNLSSSPV